MQLEVARSRFSEQSTQGELLIDGKHECYTLEPRKDQSKGKPFCIPLGTYKLELQWSNHFQRITPHILDVPGFDAIEIHPGNFPSNTEGCTLVGKEFYADVLGQSDAAFNDLMTKISGQDSLSITYSEPVPPEEK